MLDPFLTILLVAAGLVVGFFLGVVAMSMRKSAPNSKPSTPRSETLVKGKVTTLRRPAFELSYPTSWKMDMGGVGDHPDRKFTLMSPRGVCTISFEILSGLVDAKRRVGSVADIQAEVVHKNAKTRRGLFSSWGNYQGEGVALNGTDDSGRHARTSVFAHAFSSGGFLVVIITDPNNEAVNAELKLIADSFRLTNEA